MTQGKKISRRKFIVGAAGAVVVAAAGATAYKLLSTPAPTPTPTPTPTPSATVSAKPVLVERTLPLTGFFSANGKIHNIVDQLAVERVNSTGGFLGRPVKETVLDDRSDLTQVSTLYERIITGDKPDFIMGPYATPFIAAAMAVAAKYDRLYIHSTYTLPKQVTDPCAFSAWATGYNTDIDWPTEVFQALQNSAGGLPKTAVIVNSTHPGATFVAGGVPQVAQKFGVQIVDSIKYELGTTDFLPIATKIKQSKPDFLFQCGLVLDEANMITALEKVGFRPKGHHSLWPAIGAVVGLPSGAGNYLMSQSMFEEHPPFTNNLEGAWLVENFDKRAKEAGLAYTRTDTQAAVAYIAWQILRAGVTGANTLDEKAICSWLKNNKVSTIVGEMTFNGPNKYGPMKMYIGQIQNGEQTVVWPSEWAKPGSKLIYPSPLAKGY